MQKRNPVLWLCLALLIFIGSQQMLSAEEADVATITKFFGKAQILSNPSVKKAGSPPHVLFEDRYYNIEQARIGSKIKSGSVIQTAEKTMVRLVYANGDQIMVSASSSYKVTTETKQGETKPISELIYGKFRAVISKEGPRNKMEVRTRTMVMGIRGTDFHVVALDDSGASVVSVLRGAVAVSSKAPAGEASAPAVEVKSGFSAKIEALPLAPVGSQGSTATVPKPAPVVVNATDKLDLKAIQASVTFQKSDPKPNSPEQADPALLQSLAMLEQKALDSTKQDIKVSDPELYKRIEAAEAAGTKINNAEVLQAVTLEKAFVKAPEPTPEKMKKLNKDQPVAVPVKKPSSQELDELEGGIYDKYFKQ